MDDAELAGLYAGFRAHDDSATTAFVEALIVAVRSRIKARWASLKYAHRDMEEHCVTAVVEWRASGLLRDDESFAELTERLVRDSAQLAQRRAEQDEKIRDATAAVAHDDSRDPEAEVIGSRLRQRVWELQAGLDPRHQRVLEAHAQAELEDRSIAEILGVAEDNGRKMAQRAREALAAAIRTAGLTASDFLEVDDG